jgi:colanic acid/amylovoran biosynthesis glycosyltransferase
VVGQPDGHPPPGREVAYVTTRFPSVTQTFVFREVLALERSGWTVRLHAFGRSKVPAEVAREVRIVAERCEYPRLVPLLQSQLWWLWRRPRAYLGAWCFALAGTWPKGRAMGEAVAVVPVAAMFGRTIAARGITHTHAHWATGPALAAAVIARLTGGSYSFTAHAYDIQLDRTMLRAKAKNAAFVATISELNRVSLEREFAGTPATVRVVHCGIDLGRFPPRPTAPGGPPFMILNVGSLEPKKGQLHLLGAVARLRRQGYDVRAQFVGDGSQRRLLGRRAAELGIAAAVTFCGALSSTQVRRSLEQAHVFALPSVQLPSGLTEGIPVALMEAMAVGVPVVASRVSAVHELVVDGVNGLTVPPGNDEALAAALASLLDDPALAQRLTAAAVQTVAAAFDLRKTSSELAELLRAAIG